MKNVSEMATSELRDYLSKLVADLEEVEEERTFVLSQTGLHVSAREVTKYESETSRLRAEIEEVEQRLRAKQPE